MQKPVDGMSNIKNVRTNCQSHIMYRFLGTPWGSIQYRWSVRPGGRTLTRCQNELATYLQLLPVNMFVEDSGKEVFTNPLD